MKSKMKQELLWLTYTVILTALLWIPYILNRLKERGLAAATDPNIDMTPKAAWAKRLMNAHKNAVENLIIFASLVLSLQAMNISTSTTSAACMIYFCARLAHAIGYTAGIPLTRTLAFATGFACQMTLAFALLGAL